MHRLSFALQITVKTKHHVQKGLSGLELVQNLTFFLGSNRPRKFNIGCDNMNACPRMPLHVSVGSKGFEKQGPCICIPQPLNDSGAVWEIGFITLATDRTITHD